MIGTSKKIIKTKCSKSVSHHNFVIILYYTSKKSVNRYWQFVGNLFQLYHNCPFFDGKHQQNLAKGLFFEVCLCYNVMV